MLSGKTIEFNAPHLLNTDAEMDSKAVPKVTLSSAVQLSKADVPIEATELGMTILVIPEYMKAKSPMV